MEKAMKTWLMVLFDKEDIDLLAYVKQDSCAHSEWTMCQ